MGYKIVKREDSFAQWFIDEFGLEKFNKNINHKKNLENGLDIWTVSRRSGAEIWFYCENKDYHEYRLSADKYFKGNRCKYCGRTKYVHPLDSFGQYIKDILNTDDIDMVWSDKNEKTPFEYTTGTEKKVWLKCLKGLHEDTYRQVKNAVKSELECPHCAINFNTSKLQNKVYDFVKENFSNVNREHGCSIRPINPRTKCPLPLDIEIADLKLIIEINGKQHYDVIGNQSKWLNGMSPEEYLHDRKLKDRYKRMFVKRNGYYYLEIPYYCDDKNETWKKLILNKIEEIKNSKGNND